MKKSVLIILVVFLFPSVAVASKQQVSPFSIKSSAFKGFDKCSVSRELSEVREKLFSNRKPTKIGTDSWMYAISGKIMGLPIKEIEFGTCGSDGSRDCGFAIYIALIIPKPLKETRDYLKKKTGIDFTKEVRDNEVSMTMRPALTTSNKNSKESVLYCDSGDL